MTERPFITEAEFLEVVEAICKRPQMYTHKGSFDEVIAFLEGYGMGANVGATSSHSAFTPFLNWWRENFGISPALNYSWEIFRSRYASDDEAIANLSILYREYAESLAPRD